MTGVRRPTSKKSFGPEEDRFLFQDENVTLKEAVLLTKLSRLSNLFIKAEWLETDLRRGLIGDMRSRSVDVVASARGSWRGDE